MLRIFLAHASEDKEAVTRLYHQLRSKGYQPWLDKVDLLPGQSWRAEIPRAIRECQVFIACLSQCSVAKQGYIQREFRLALNTFADKPPGSIYLIPLRLDDCDIPELHQEDYGLNLRDIQWVDWFAVDGFDRLVRSLEAGFPDVHSEAAPKTLETSFLDPLAGKHPALVERHESTYQSRTENLKKTNEEVETEHLDEVKPLRYRGTTNAIVFVHGFAGSPIETWKDFSHYLMESPALDGWDVFSLGYSSSLAPDLRGMWMGNPSIQTLADYLVTRTELGSLNDYKALAFVAHSMGGLVVQRALLDRPELLKRTAHVFLFGTPSDGLKKVGWVKWFNPQIKDMVADGSFICKLRQDRETLWPNQPPLNLWAIAGDADEFVPASTSLGPFLKEQRIVVPGKHLEMIHPKSASDLSVQAVVKGIQGEAAPTGPWNSASVALQMLDYRKAVEVFEAHSDELDDAHLVQLACALEGLGEAEKAVAVLEGAGKRGTDVTGVLAGRLKRRWIANGRASDYDRAKQLYLSAYQEAAAEKEHPQALYYGINVCFLLAANLGPQPEIEQMAQQVLIHCDLAPKDFWCLGTQGEAKLHFGEDAGALAAYRTAVAMEPVPEPWQLKSMYSQACQLLSCLNRESLLNEMAQIFRQGDELSSP